MLVTHSLNFGKLLGILSLAFLLFENRVCSEENTQPKIELITNCEIQNENRLKDPNTDQEITTCLRCVPGFILTRNGQTCMQTSTSEFENCIQVGIFNECIVCECGFGWDNQMSKCVSLPLYLEGCQKFEGYNCLQPKPDFQILVEVALSQFVQVSIEFSHGTNCEIKLIDGQCQRCHHGYILSPMENSNNYICTRFPFKIHNSFFSYFDGETLLSRDIRLIALDNKGVYPIIDKCLTHILYQQISTSIPRSYNNNNNEISGRHLEVERLSEKPGNGEEKRVNMHGTNDNLVRCTVCEQGNIPNQSKTSCFKSPIELCGEVSDLFPQRCAECFDSESFYLLDYGNSAENSDEMECVRRKRSEYNGCIIYSKTRDECEKCRKPFVLFQNDCVHISSIMISSESDSEDDDDALINPTTASELNQLHLFVPNCLIYNEKFECLECEVNYVVTNKAQCVLLIDPNCLLADTNGGCLKCQIGMENDILLHRCIMKYSSNCLQTSIVQGQMRCIICYMGFFIDRFGACSPIDYCNVSDGINMRCHVCKSLYFLNMNDNLNGVSFCDRITHDLGCFMSDGITDKCLICKRHYEKSSSGKCVPKVKHNSVQCYVSGYFFSDIQDMFCKPHSKEVMNGCVHLDNREDKCLQCAPGQYLDLQTGGCQIINGCILSEGFKNICVKAQSSNAYVDENGVVQITDQGCMTNSIDNICMTKDIAGRIRKQFRAAESGSYQEIRNFEVDESLLDLNCFMFANRDELTNKSTPKDPAFKWDSVVCVQCNNLNYPNLEGKCERVSITSCRLTNGKEKKCRLCMDGFRVDENTGNCILIERSVNSHCEQLGVVSGCAKCESLFYSFNNGCNAIDDPTCEISNGIQNSCTCFNSNDLNKNICRDRFCEIFNQEKESCDKCFHGFNLVAQEGSERVDQNLRCKKNEQLNCLTLSQGVFCSECEEGYYKSPIRPIFSICQKITMPNCIRMIDLSYECAECSPGFQLTEKGICVYIHKCTQFSRVCTACESPYILTDFNTCTKIDNCLVTENSLCTLCKNPYYISQSKQACILIKYCELAGSGNKNECEICLPSFHKFGSECIPDVPIENCSEYSENSTCIRCNQLFYVNESLTCSRISNYRFCRSSNGRKNQCVECEHTGYALHLRTFECFKMHNCTISDGIHTCLFCERLFYRNMTLEGKSFNYFNRTLEHLNGTSSEQHKWCVPRTRIPKCLVYDSNSDSCESCESLYSLSHLRQECIQFPENLSQTCFFSEGILRECQICRTFQRSALSRIRYSQLNFRSTLFESPSTTCSTFVNGIRNAVCSNNYYEYNKQVLATPKPTCGKRQKPSFSNCVRYFADKPGCQECASGFYLRTTASVTVNISGNQNDSTSEGNQSIPDEKTNDFDQDYEALPYGSYCERIPTANRVNNCAVYETNSNICKKCSSKLSEEDINQISDQNIVVFWLDKQKNQCINVLKQNCARMQESQPVCEVTHIPNCEVLSENCFDCKKNKDTLPNQLTCLKCKSGYYKDNYQCLKHKKIEYCEIYSLDTKDYCELCQPSHFPSQKQDSCRPRIDFGCADKYFNKKLCSKCKEGYVLIDLGRLCMERQIQNCLLVASIDSDKCMRCYVDFEFDANRNCVRAAPEIKDPHCFSYEKSKINAALPGRETPQYQCKSCKDGYFLSSNYECLSIHNSVCSIRNCNSYSETSRPDSYHCQSCAKGFEVSSDNSFTCIDSNSKLKEEGNTGTNDQNGDNNTNNQNNFGDKNKNQTGDKTVSNQEEKDDNSTNQEGIILSIAIILGITIIGIVVYLILKKIKRNRIDSLLNQPESQLENQHDLQQEIQSKSIDISMTTLSNTQPFEILNEQL